MHASLRSVRIAPKKAQLIAKMIRGMAVPDAVTLLDRTNKKAAKVLQALLRSAMANASHNEKQDPQMLVIRSLTVNKAQAYHRGVPMARGRVRPMRKFLSHIELRLGVADGDEASLKPPAKKEEAKSPKNTSQTPKKTVQKTAASTKSTSTKGKSSKKDTTASSSKSSASKNAKSSSKLKK